MKRSTSRILTTHVGSLPRPDALIRPLHAKDTGQPHDKDELARGVAESVADVVRRQAELGIDVTNDGEHSKSGFSSYHLTRLTGYSVVDSATNVRQPSRDQLQFPAAYAEQRAMNATRPIRTARRLRDAPLVCTGPITYSGQAYVREDIENLRAAMGSVRAEEGFLTAISVADLAQNNPNEFYRTQEEYATALADAMNEEYKAIVDAGFVLQIDSPLLATHWDRHPELSIADCRAFISAQVELMNHSLRGIPAERVRFHTCYSVNVAPRVHDLELKHYVDLMLKINAGAYTFEASNPRHEHEWLVWREVKLPDEKILIPGVVSHCVYLVEHPELVAQRIVRFASVVGRERVIASNDCGFATAAAGDEVHPDVAWAKLGALSEGARLATQELWA